jgi:alpha,alpha-trehalase
MRNSRQSPLQFLSYFLRGFILVAVSCGLAQGQASSGRAGLPEGKGLNPILSYISTAWDTLTRSMNDCQSVVDPKVSAPAILYLPAKFSEPAAVEKLASECHVQVGHLPIVIQHLGEIDASKIQPPGLLYLPNQYVVPGGRFNEMYGWDSYFIIRGLLRAGRLELARGMVDNFFFEIEHYGAMLNANRTYYLTRSQPPFLSSMFVAVYEVMKKNGNPDQTWLERAYADISKDYEMWTSDPHLAGTTGLSRYYDFGDGPPPEAIQDETGFYRKVAQYFFLHPAEADGYVIEMKPDLPQPDLPQQDVPQPDASQQNVSQLAAGAEYSLQVCDAATAKAHPECEPKREFKLSADYYKGDRSMRESGFDVSFRFGPFGAATHHYAPVCLNSLLYKTEKDLEQISRWLGRTADAEKWNQRSEERKKLITRYLWNQEQGLFFDYDFTTRKMSTYKYASTFYPLWVGLATPEQAKAVAGNLKIFEKPGGIAMSTDDSGAQWDLPYGWGNIETLAVKGLYRYGFSADADRIAFEFLSTVAENFRRDGNIREKYNVVTRSSEAHVELGYGMNVVGFGWTNAAFLELLHGLPKETVERLEQNETSSRAR